MIARFPPGINEHAVLLGKPAPGSQGRMDRELRVGAFAQPGKRLIGSARSRMSEEIIPQELNSKGPQCCVGLSLLVPSFIPFVTPLLALIPKKFPSWLTRTRLRFAVRIVCERLMVRARNKETQLLVRVPKAE